MLSKIKLLLGISDNTKDTLLNVLIEQMISEAQAYTHNDNICEYEPAVIKMVIYNYNRLGTEGVTSENYSGVSFAYTEDYPEDILRLLRKHRKVVFL